MSKNTNVKNLDKLFVPKELVSSESEKLAIEPYSYWRSVSREFIVKRSVKISLVILALLVIFAIIVPFVSNANIAKLNYDDKFKLPSLNHLFGADANGRDIFTRTFIGLRLTLFIALAAATINTFVGVLVGTIWGYFRKIDIFMIEVYNFLSNIPIMLQYFVLIIVLKGFGIGSIPALIIGMTLTGWIYVARFLRNRILIFNNREYNIASRTLGSGPKRIIIYNLLPQILTVVITQVSISIPAYVGTEVGLAYFGIGLKQTDISLGKVISAGYRTWVYYPHTLLYPVLVLAMFTISIYLIGLALSDAIDPRTHR